MQRCRRWGSPATNPSSPRCFQIMTSVLAVDKSGERHGECIRNSRPDRLPRNPVIGSGAGCYPRPTNPHRADPDRESGSTGNPRLPPHASPNLTSPQATCFPRQVALFFPRHCSYVTFSSAARRCTDRYPSGRRRRPPAGRRSPSSSGRGRRGALSSPRPPRGGRRGRRVGADPC